MCEAAGMCYVDLAEQSGDNLPAAVIGLSSICVGGVGGRVVPRIVC